MKLIEEVLKAGLTWSEAIREMNEDYSYVIKNGCDKIVLLTDEEGELFAIDEVGETILHLANIPPFDDSTYSTVKITDEALALLKANLY